MYVADYARFGIAFGLVLACFTLGVLASLDDEIQPDHRKYCCYPSGDEYTRGSIGNCDDEYSHVYTMTTKTSCMPYSTVGTIFIVTAVLSAAAAVYYTHWSRGSFYVSAAKQIVHVLEQESKEREYFNEGKLTWEAQGKSRVISLSGKEKDNLVEKAMKRHHRLYWTVAILPQSILYGVHLKVIGEHLFHIVYLLSGIVCVITSLLLAYPISELDGAWRCYTDDSLRGVTLGRCDDPKSAAHQKLKVSESNHIDAFWGCVGLICVCGAAILIIYFSSLLNWSKWYFRHLAKNRGLLMDAYEKL